MKRTMHWVEYHNLTHSVPIYLVTLYFILSAKLVQIE